MTKGDLIERLKSIPDDAKVFMWCDHGQTNFTADTITATTFDVSGIEYESEDIDWTENDAQVPITAIELS
ncbi:MAG: hypothetical protein DRQ78_08270 [Epsilonproteobacteria bacterium]|nr:MAG: hypothetical protein DRQ78_08270 [Campylobacterota bacterium]